MFSVRYLLRAKKTSIKNGSHSYHMLSIRGAVRKKKELSLKHITHCVPCQVGANAEETEWTISWCSPPNE
jgi:hypothetical protein